MSIHTVTSGDGTKIACEVHGSGPALIIVQGALNDRTFGSTPYLADLLAKDFTVCTYDRRGRGDSGDTQPYAVEREIEDLDALITLTGGMACVYGHSSGAALALQAAARLGSRIVKLALYELPSNDDPQAKAVWREYISRLTRLLAEGKNSEAPALFLQLSGMPPDRIAGMQHAPFWPALVKAAPTLAYDHTAILGRENAVPAETAGRVMVPALVMYGGNSYPFMKVTAETLGGIMPYARVRVLEGQTHEVRPEALVPVLVDFFKNH